MSEQEEEPTSTRRQRQMDIPPPHTGFTRRSRLQKLAEQSPEPPPPEPKSAPSPPPLEATAAPKSGDPPPFLIGLGVILGVILMVKACNFIIPTPPENDEPEVAKQYYRGLEYSRSADKVCEVMDNTRMVISCTADRENRVVARRNGNERSRNDLLRISSNVDGADKRLIGSGWRLRINDSNVR